MSDDWRKKVLSGEIKQLPITTKNQVILIRYDKELTFNRFEWNSALRKALNERGHEGLVIILSQEDDINFDTLDEKQMNKYGWYKNER